MSRPSQSKDEWNGEQHGHGQDDERVPVVPSHVKHPPHQHRPNDSENSTYRHHGPHDRTVMSSAEVIGYKREPHRNGSAKTKAPYGDKAYEMQSAGAVCEDKRSHKLARERDSNQSALVQEIPRKPVLSLPIKLKTETPRITSPAVSLLKPKLLTAGIW